MELTSHKPCIISAGIGAWYAKGIDRLERSLIFHGYPGDMLFWRDEYPPGCPSHQDSPYAFKPYAFKEAFKRGYKVVLWLDASFWAMNNPMPLMDYINEHGLYFFKSGYSLAQTATDKLIQEMGLPEREKLIDIPEFATGAVGIHCDNPNGHDFFIKWLRSCRNGDFRGNRSHDVKDSAHPLFLHARQDQSAASGILYKMGIKTAGEDEDFVAYYDSPYNGQKCLFFIQGL